MKRNDGAFTVCQLAGVVTKIELAGVATKMRFAHMEIGANDAAFENGKEIFGGIRMLVTAVLHIFLGAVIGGVVSGKLAANAGINRAFIGDKVSRAVHIGNDKSANGFGIDVGNMEAANMAFTFNQCDNGFLRCRTGMGAVTGLPPTNVSSASTTPLPPPRGPVG